MHQVDQKIANRQLEGGNAHLSFCMHVIQRADYSTHHYLICC